MRNKLLYLAIVRINNAMEDGIRNLLTKNGLTPPTYKTLLAIDMIDKEKKLVSMLEVADMLQNSRANVTFTADQLEKIDLCERVPSKRDRRIINLRLTEKGKQLLKKLDEDIDRAIQKTRINIPQIIGTTNFLDLQQVFEDLENV